MAKNNDKKGRKVAINASFDDLVKMSVEGNPAPKPKGKYTIQDKVKVMQKLSRLVKDARAYAKNKKAGGQSPAST